MRSIQPISLAFVAALFLLLSAAPLSADNRALFYQMGGEKVLRKTVQELSEIVLEDERINFTFANADMDVFRARLFEQLCDLSGGPCQYEGRDMESAHADLAVSNAQFNALAENLYIALKRAGVPYRLQNKLLALLAPMQSDIVTR